MTLKEYADMIRGSLGPGDFDSFFPSLFLPERPEVGVLEEVPDGVDVEQATLQWAASVAADDEELLVAFKVSANQFKAIRRTKRKTEQMVFDVNCG